MTDAAADRIETLERTAAHQQQTIDELSDALADHWRTIETLRRQIDRLSERISDIEPQAGQSVPIDRPPHW